MELYFREKIELLRRQMIEEASAQGSLIHDKVVAISQQLDQYLMIYQMLVKKGQPENTFEKSLVV